MRSHLAEAEILQLCVCEERKYCCLFIDPPTVGELLQQVTGAHRTCDHGRCNGNVNPVSD